MNERYMREWLNGMVAAKYLSYEPSTYTYFIPHENIPVLAEGSSLPFFFFFLFCYLLIYHNRVWTFVYGWIA
jgi:hypothetical protein